MMLLAFAVDLAKAAAEGPWGLPEGDGFTFTFGPSMSRPNTRCLMCWWTPPPENLRLPALPMRDYGEEAQRADQVSQVALPSLQEG